MYDHNQFCVLIVGFICTLLICEGSSQSCAPKFQQFPGHTACMAASAQAAPITLSAQDKQAIVDKHNELRGNVTPPAADMLMMSWDDEVAMVAQRWADVCSLPLHHDKYREIPGRFGVGQNIMVGGSSLSYEGSVQGWYNEVKKYTYGQTNNLWTTGHYTQVVWAQTYKVGCGATMCGSTKLFVCNYAPFGNIEPFTEPYSSVGGRCAKCKTCQHGHCHCPGVECNMGTLNPTTCQCECLQGVSFYNSGDCQLNCSDALSDHVQCGDQTFPEKKCTHFGVNRYCPHMCRLCPQDFRESGATSTLASVVTTVVLLAAVVFTGLTG